MSRDFSPLRRRYMIVAAVLMWFALSLQICLTTTLTVADERGVMAGVIAFLGYFTILTNILTATALTVPLIAAGSRLAAFLAWPVAQGAIVTYISIVGIVYSLLLRHSRQAAGPWLWADVILHDIAPVLFVVYWLMFVPKGWLRWKHATIWLSYPAVYLVYTLLRGAVVDRYPYPFIDVASLGYARVFANAAALTGAFLIVGLAFVAIDRALSARRRPA